MSREPEASRPFMPGYGILDATSGRGLLPWSWAVERLTKARNYFISTTREDGRPHLMPVWGVWLDDSFFFSTGPDSRKAKNLAVNNFCAISPEGADEAVIVEGTAAQLTDPSLVKRVLEAYNKKYKWNMDGSEGPIYSVRPRIAFGFDINDGLFIGSATRWKFESE
jgi:nitroimidazol reductase NimA-like FMN-containing flavoprotein (pyridoxamine 5'-phosphate oxidase superfamily)